MSYVNDGPEGTILITGAFSESLDVLGHVLEKEPPTDNQVDGFILALMP